MSKVRVVVVGNSYASYCQLPGLVWASSHGDVAADVVALCAKNLPKAQQTAQRFGIPLATTSLDEALGQKPDLVIVSTPVDLHAPQVEQVFAVAPAAAVLCEKPFTLAHHDARRLAELARGRVALVDHQLRWSAPRRRLRQLVLGGAVGDAWVARSEMCFGSVERMTRKANWWDDASRGGGAMQAIGSHLVDGLLWTLGPVAFVQARLTTCVKTRTDDDGAQQPVTADDHCELWLTHASGCRSTVLCSVVQTHGRRSLVEVIGARGVVRLVDEEQLFVGKHEGALERVDVRMAAVDEVDACNDSAFARAEPLFLRDVLAAVARGDRSLDGAATFDDGAAVVGVLSAARP